MRKYFLAGAALVLTGTAAFALDDDRDVRTRVHVSSNATATLVGEQGVVVEVRGADGDRTIHIDNDGETSVLEIDGQQIEIIGDTVRVDGETIDVTRDGMVVVDGADIRVVTGPVGRHARELELRMVEHTAHLADMERRVADMVIDLNVDSIEGTVAHSLELALAGLESNRIESSEDWDELSEEERAEVREELRQAREEIREAMHEMRIELRAADGEMQREHRMARVEIERAHGEMARAERERGRAELSEAERAEVREDLRQAREDIRKAMHEMRVELRAADGEMEREHRMARVEIERAHREMARAEREMGRTHLELRRVDEIRNHVDVDRMSGEVARVNRVLRETDTSNVRIEETDGRRQVWIDGEEQTGDALVDWLNRLELDRLAGGSGETLHQRRIEHTDGGHRIIELDDGEQVVIMEYRSSSEDE